MPVLLPKVHTIARLRKLYARRKHSPSASLPPPCPPPSSDSPSSPLPPPPPPPSTSPPHDKHKSGRKKRGRGHPLRLLAGIRSTVKKAMRRHHNSPATHQPSRRFGPSSSTGAPSGGNYSGPISHCPPSPSPPTTVQRSSRSSTGAPPSSTGHSGHTPHRPSSPSHSPSSPHIGRKNSHPNRITSTGALTTNTNYNNNVSSTAKPAVVATSSTGTGRSRPAIKATGRAAQATATSSSRGKLSSTIQLLPSMYPGAKSPSTVSGQAVSPQQSRPNPASSRETKSPKLTRRHSVGGAPERPRPVRDSSRDRKQTDPSDMASPKQSRRPRSQSVDHSTGTPRSPSVPHPRSPSPRPPPGYRLPDIALEPQGPAWWSAHEPSSASHAHLSHGSGAGGRAQTHKAPPSPTPSSSSQRGEHGATTGSGRDGAGIGVSLPRERRRKTKTSSPTATGPLGGPTPTVPRPSPPAAHRGTLSRSNSLTSLKTSGSVRDCLSWDAGAASGTLTREARQVSHRLSREDVSLPVGQRGGDGWNSHTLSSGSTSSPPHPPPSTTSAPLNPPPSTTSESRPAGLPAGSIGPTGSRQSGSKVGSGAVLTGSGTGSRLMGTTIDSRPTGFALTESGMGPGSFRTGQAGSSKTSPEYKLISCRKHNRSPPLGDPNCSPSPESGGSRTSLLSWFAHRVKSPGRAGTIGLRNLGNTCYMNSMLQCLGHTEPLARALLKRKGKRGQLVRAYHDLMKTMWDGEMSSSYFILKTLKDRFGRLYPRFSGYSQHDAQEFMRFLVSGLHEELRDRADNVEPPVLDGISDFEAGERLWAWQQRLDSSPLSRLFMGQLQSTLTCQHCGATSVTFDPFWDLALPFPNHRYQGSSAVELTACLDQFTRAEKLDGSESPTCGKCKVARPSTKQFTIHRFPPVVVLHLKRFAGWAYRTKLETAVCVPTSLSLAGYASPDSVDRKGPVSYELYAVTNHVGGVYSGHYTAEAKNHKNGHWYSFNDSTVTKHSSGDVAPQGKFRSSQAYILFYQRQSVKCSTLSDQLASY